MLEGLDDTELEAYLDENPWIIPLFKIDVLEAATEYAPTSTLQEEYEPNPGSMLELSRAREAFEKEMEISQRVMRQHWRRLTSELRRSHDNCQSLRTWCQQKKRPWWSCSEILRMFSCGHMRTWKSWNRNFINARLTWPQMRNPCNGDDIAWTQITRPT